MYISSKGQIKIGMLIATLVVKKTWKQSKYISIGQSLNYTHPCMYYTKNDYVYKYYNVLLNENKE